MDASTAPPATVRHFLQVPDLTAGQVAGVLRRALRLKSGAEGSDRPLAGRSLGMIFRKSSTRTRVSFEVGMHELGGHAIFLGDQDSQVGRGESLADTARVLSRYVHAITIRTHAHEDVEELARHSAVPVVNALSDLLHPCQILADLLTVVEELPFEPEDLSPLKVAWIGDGNNVAHSWIQAAGTLGFSLALATPEGYEPDEEILRKARDSGGSVTLTRDASEAARGAHVVTTDVWASMGQESEAEARREALAAYRVDEALMERAANEAIFLHCLPAHRGEEVTAAVLEGPRSRVWSEAENRLHAQKALLVDLIGC